jgi:hypothetical protein
LTGNITPKNQLTKEKQKNISFIFVRLREESYKRRIGKSQFKNQKCGQKKTTD